MFGEIIMQPPVAVTDTLRKIQFVSSTAGYILTATSGVFKTMDAGVTWLQYTTGFDTQGLKNMYFSQNGTGSIVGAAGLLLTSGDGGVTWDRQLTATTKGLNTVYYSADGMGILGGDNGTILQALPALSLVVSGGLVTLPLGASAYEVALNRVNTQNIITPMTTVLGETPEAELRRGLDSKLYVNQLPPLGIQFTSGGLGGLTVNINLNQSGSGILRAAKLPQNHRHTIKLFDINALTAAIKYRTVRSISTEVIAANKKAQRPIITFDYSPKAQYIYYMQYTGNILATLGTANKSILRT
jgi:hypothetical protein